MQYKIPTNIENADKIIGPLSLMQIIVIAPGATGAYMIFNRFSTSIDIFPLLMICGAVVGIFAFMALFNISEMNFIQWILNIIRAHLNQKKRRWIQWVDSFSGITLGYTRLQGWTPIKRKKVSKDGEKNMEDILKHI